MRRTIATCFMMSAMGLAPPRLPAQTISEETLHGFCGGAWTSTTCSTNGVITPTNSLAGGFGFTRAPDNNDGWTAPQIWVVFLIPNSTNVGSFSVNTTLMGPVVDPATQEIRQWLYPPNSNFADFLGLVQEKGPTNPIDAFLPSTQALATGASGYTVYRANLGAVHFGQYTDPTFTTDLTPPAGTVVFAYITDISGGTHIMDSTSNGTALLVSPVPEPATIVGLGTIVLLMTRLVRKKLSNQHA
jgi:hypothetical protein